jgi:carbamoyltransferase
LAGGVALNCVANGKVLRDKKFENLWVQPAAGDAGGALGAALGAYHTFNARPRASLEKFDSMNGSYLGPSYDQSDIEKRLIKLGAVFEVFDNQDLIEKGVDALLNGNAVGWFQGRMEFGPRALGGRSILADPRCPKMQKTLNLKVKYRESFRPFAPSVRYEDVDSWFKLDVSSPYMLIVSEIKEKYRLAYTKKQKELFGIEKLNIPRSKVPAITHVDYSARVQTVHSDTNPLYHKLLTQFKQRSGCPILVNTSFNVRGEPIVCFPEDAFRCFMGTGIETLIIGNCYLKKDAQKTDLKTDYKDSFELD